MQALPQPLEPGSATITGDGFIRLMRIAGLLFVAFVAVLAFFVSVFANRFEAVEDSIVVRPMAASTTTDAAAIEAPSNASPTQPTPLATPERPPAPTTKPRRHSHDRAGNACVRVYRAGSGTVVECGF